MRQSVESLFQALSLNTGLHVPAVFEQKLIPSLNGLRAVAILFVLFDHIRYGFHCPAFIYKANKFLAFGSFGVQIFFVISGFLITGILLKEKVQTGTINFKRFYLRRALRIFPVFYFYLITILVLKYAQIAFAGNEAVMSAFLFVSNFFNVHDSWLVAHTWSLSVEEQFYLCWPLLIIFMPRKYYTVFIAIVIYNLFYYFLRFYHPLFVLRFFFIVAPALIAGAMLAIALYKNWFKNMHHRLMHPAFAFSLLFAMLMYLPRQFDAAPWFSTPFDYLLSSLFIALFIYYAIHCDTKSLVYKVLNFAALSYIGVLSYSIYLWQEPFFAFSINYRVYPFWTVFPQNVVLIFVTALLSYYLIERPFLTLRKHIR